MDEMDIELPELPAREMEVSDGSSRDEGNAAGDPAMGMFRGRGGGSE